MSAEDFTTRLQLQLREAAEREERRTAIGRRTAGARAALALRWAPGPLLAAAAVVALLLVGLWTLTASDPEPEPATPPGLRIVSTVPLGETLNGGAVVAFGALWVSDSGRGEIVRVDPGTRKVTARIPVGGETDLAASHGSLWAVRNRVTVGRESGPLLRIDPRTRRIVARIALRTPGGDLVGGAFPLVGPRIWVIGRSGALAVDPARNRVVRHVAISSAGYNVENALIHDRELWLTSSSGSTVRYDARTGRRLGRLSWRPGPVLIPYRDRFVELGRSTVALVAPDTGRAAWRSRVTQETHWADVVGDRVIVVGLDGTSPRERLWEVDARTGRVSRPIVLPAFGPVRILGVGEETWVLMQSGSAVVVRR
ncbi:MAG TPA: PQQ-binding-like beta-propeller repeat protein [Solirubrobacteraceae bacterium]|nr:PQQ-binding-like beta-propeller repeat protein [Solirubrobacteraceae bacterium]